MGKVMRVYLCGQDWTNSHEEMYLDLPAAPWELVDTMEKLNLTEEADLYVQAEEYYDFDYIQGFIPECTSLSQLNEHCATLNSMDEMDRIGFCGLLQSSAFFDRFSLGIDKLMDIAQAKGCYHIADLIFIKNVWEELTYQVKTIRIVYPDDIDAILIQPGKDMVTLMTCHLPNTGGRYRYLVYCERAENEEADA